MKINGLTQDEIDSISKAIEAMQKILNVATESEVKVSDYKNKMKWQCCNHYICQCGKKIP